MRRFEEEAGGIAFAEPSMTDPRYMEHNPEIPQYYTSTDDNGGTLDQFSGPLGIAAFGIPRTDVERAMNHYHISEAEYLAHPDWYPLPPRGTRFIPVRPYNYRRGRY